MLMLLRRITANHHSYRSKLYDMLLWQLCRSTHYILCEEHYHIFSELDGIVHDGLSIRCR